MTGRRRNGKVLASATIAILMILPALPVGTVREAAGSHTALTGLIVDDDGVECPHATHGSIQAAVDAAGPDQTIRICTGTYPESVSILGQPKQGLRLVADGDVVLDGGAVRDVGITVRDAPEVRIEGLTIRDYRTGIRLERSPDDGPALSTTVVGNLISAPGVDTEGSLALHTPRPSPTGIEIEALEEVANASVTVRGVTDVAIRGNEIRDVLVGIRGVDVRRNRIVDNEIAARTDLPPSLEDDPFAISTGIHLEPSLEGNPFIDLARNLPRFTRNEACLRLASGGEEGEAPFVDPLLNVVEAFTGEDPLPDPVAGTANTTAAMACPPLGNASDPVLPSTERGVENTIARNRITASGTSGILLDAERRDRVVDNTVLGSEGTGILVVRSESVVLEDNRVEDSAGGIELILSPDPKLRGNAIADSRYGLSIMNGWESEDYPEEIPRSNTVDGDPVVYLKDVQGGVVDASDDPAAVIAVNATDIAIRNVSIDGSFEAIHLVSVDRARVENVDVAGSWTGVRIEGGSQDNRILDSSVAADDTGIRVVGHGNSGNRIARNRVSGGSLPDHPATGISWWRANDNVVADNRIVDATFGIRSRNDEGNLIQGNTITRTGWALTILPWDDLRIEDNRVHDNYQGIYLGRGSFGGRATMRGNQLADNTYSFGALGPHDIDRSNTVDGDPIVYLVHVENRTIDATSDAGYVGIMRSTNVTVRGLDLGGNVMGVSLRRSSDVRIEDVRVEDALWGVQIRRSWDVVVEGGAMRVPTDPPRVPELLRDDPATAGSPWGPVPTVGVGIVEGLDVRVDDVAVPEAYYGAVASRGSAFISYNVTLDGLDVGSAYYGVYALVSERVRIVDANLGPATPFGEGGVAAKLREPTTTSGTGSAGVVALAADDVTVAGSTISNATFGAVSWLSGSPGVRVTNSTVTGTSAAIASWGSTGDRIVGNDLEANRLGLVASRYVHSNGGTTEPDDLRATDNVVEGNEDGVLVAASPDAGGIVISGNGIVSSLDAGVRIAADADAQGVEVHGNAIVGNGGLGVDAHAADGVLDATGNWWGAPDGPSGGLADPATGEVADGGGDPVSDDVRFDPWLDDPPPVGDEVTVVASPAPAAPQVEIEVPIVPGSRVTVPDDATISAHVVDPDGEVTNVTVHPDGSGSPALEAEPDPDRDDVWTAGPVSYGTAGLKTIVVEATDDGNVTTATRTIEVTPNRDPRARIDASPGGLAIDGADAEVRLDGSASRDPDGHPVRAVWEIADGTWSDRMTVGSSSNVPPITWEPHHAGVWNATLHLSDPHGARDTATVRLEVDDAVDVDAGMAPGSAAVGPDERPVVQARVTGVGGGPVADATVTFAVTHVDSGVQTGTVSTSTGDDGRVEAEMPYDAGTAGAGANLLGDHRVDLLVEADNRLALAGDDGAGPETAEASLTYEVRALS